MTVHRLTARVIPVSPAGRVLLLRGHDPQRPEVPYWFTIGGGIEAGESEKHAALRELREETGIVCAPADLGEPFHRGDHSYSYDGVEMRARSAFFALAVGQEVAIHPAAPSPGEIITAGRWWFPGDLSSVRLSNPHLPGIVLDAVDVVRRQAQ